MGILFHRAAHGCQRLKHSCRPSYTLIVVLCCILSGALANPVITVRYSADPSAHIFPGDTRLWIYASHDHDDAEDMKTMSEYYVYSTHDLVRGNLVCPDRMQLVVFHGQPSNTGALAIV